jgi:hypothetical protein
MSNTWTRRQEWGAHASVAVVTLAAACIAFKAFPELVHDEVATFSSVGTFITVYAALFAVVEALRARSAAREADLAAKLVAERFRRLLRTESITSCTNHIEVALETLKDGSGIPITLLSKIVGLYSQLFAQDIARAGSVHAANNAIVLSYLNLAKPQKNPRKTIAALTQMKGHLLVLKDSIIFPERP